jgi:hypothetical protein
MNYTQIYQSFDSLNQKYYSPDHNIPPTAAGNTSQLLNWLDIIDNLKIKKGKELPEFDKENIHYKKMTNLFSSTSNFNNMQWINYYPSIHYDQEIDKLICNFLGHTDYARAWISEVRPGKVVPWHYDFDDNEKEYLTKNKVVRYSIKITEDRGHISVVGNHLLTGILGDVFKWNDHRDWHGSLNCSYVSKFQYNLLAYK